MLATEARDLQLEHDKLTQRHASSSAAMEDAVQKFQELNATPRELNATDCVEKHLLSQIN